MDEVDCEGVSPLLGAVRRGHFRVAERLLRAGAFQQPWTWTKRKGKRWHPLKAAKYSRLVSAVNRNQRISDEKLNKQITIPHRKKQKGTKTSKKKKS